MNVHNPDDVALLLVQSLTLCLGYLEFGGRSLKPWSSSHFRQLLPPLQTQLHTPLRRGDKA